MLGWLLTKPWFLKRIVFLLAVLLSWVFSFLFSIISSLLSYQVYTILQNVLCFQRLLPLSSFCLPHPYLCVCLEWVNKFMGGVYVYVSVHVCVACMCMCVCVCLSDVTSLTSLVSLFQISMAEGVWEKKHYISFLPLPLQRSPHTWGLEVSAWANFHP